MVMMIKIKMQKMVILNCLPTMHGSFINWFWLHQTCS